MARDRYEPAFIKSVPRENNKYLEIIFVREKLRFYGKNYIFSPLTFSEYSLSKQKKYICVVSNPT